MTDKLPLVADYMATELHTLGPDTDIHYAVGFLIDNRISGAPVVDDGKLVGILSEKDCLRLLATGVDHTDPQGTVKDFMVSAVETIPSNVNIYFVAGMFLQKPFRRFPVVDDGVLVGQISRRDILRAIQERFAARRK